MTSGNPSRPVRTSAIWRGNLSSPPRANRGCKYSVTGRPPRLGETSSRRPANVCLLRDRSTRHLQHARSLRRWRRVDEVSDFHGARRMTKSTLSGRVTLARASSLRRWPHRNRLPTGMNNSRRISHRPRCGWQSSSGALTIHDPPPRAARRAQPRPAMAARS